MEDKSKRFWWLKLKDDFFDDESIAYVLEQDNGALYIIFYEKLCLVSLRDDGILIRSVGDLLVPYSYERLAELTHTPLDSVRVAMELFKHIGLVKVLESGAYFLPQIASLTGSEAANDNARRQKRYREKRKLELLAQKHSENKPSVTNSNVTSVTQSVTQALLLSNESIEIRDKSIENRIKKCNKESVTRHGYGEYENVFLSDEELAKFQNEFPDWARFIEELSCWLKENGKKKKDYLATLRNWARRDFNGPRVRRAYGNNVDVGDALDNLVI